MKLFVDTWGWLVLADKKDPRHEEAAQLYADRSKRFGLVVTTNFILDETFTLLFRRRPFDEAWRFVSTLLQSPFISVAEITPERFQKTLVLRRRFSDKPRISFTDLTSMTVMNELKLHEILTEDAHFNQVGMDFRVLPN